MSVFPFGVEGSEVGHGMGADERARDEPDRGSVGNRRGSPVGHLGGRAAGAGAARPKRPIRITKLPW